mmetsp:Transcript_87470/g.168437  ORF Transcript_87470/g.168437 Transcript_87470/m.168437 type:complete len:90 (+) Transcript_87470:1223-1492(+)
MSNGAGTSGHTVQVSINGDVWSNTFVEPSKPCRQLCQCTNSTPGTVNIWSQYSCRLIRTKSVFPFSFVFVRPPDRAKNAKKKENVNEKR